MNDKLRITYRLAEEGDLDEICALVQAAVAEMERRGIFQWDEIYPAREDFLNDIKSRSLFIGQTEFQSTKRIAVIYVLNKECDEEYKTAAWTIQGDWRVLHRICVHPDFQNQGIAKMTLAHIEQKARDLGAASIRLDVFSQNPFSQRLYERAGYRKTGEANWRKGLFYLMEKDLR